MTNTANALTEEYLVDLLKKQDETVLPILYEKYSMALFGTIFNILADQELAEEQLQETFLKIWKYSNLYLLRFKKVILKKLKFKG